jgi:hypothetical protein
MHGRNGYPFSGKGSAAMRQVVCMLCEAQSPDSWKICIFAEKGNMKLQDNCHGSYCYMD